MLEQKPRLPSILRSLSARLLVLTIFFVMLSEVLIYAPSIGRYRKVYLEERLADAHLATLALEATPDQNVGEDLKAELLDHARAYGVVTNRDGVHKLVLLRDMPPAVDLVIDLRRATFMGYIFDAFSVLAQSENRILRVIGVSPKDSRVLMEVVLDEAPMRLEMYDYSQRILMLSIIISLVTATLVYLSLLWLMVRPMRQITENMMAFSENPETAASIIVPSRRSDEIGFAQRQLYQMQTGLRSALRHKARLAALGTAVTKINHDLRNILSTAQLISDRLAGIDDPEVKRVTPPLVKAIDRAVMLCSQTLDFARADSVDPQPQRVLLGTMIDDARAALPRGADAPPLVVDNNVAGDLEVEADRDQLYRVLSNLATNAAEAGATRLLISAERRGDRIYVDFADDGPGVPDKARESLFQPFAGSARSGGTGLGLAIAREIMRAHGGDVRLLNSSPEGTTFQLELPAF